MDKRTKKEKERLLEKLGTLEPASPDYRLVLNCLNSLEKVEAEKAPNKVQVIMGGLSILAYIGVSILTLKHEDVNVITSKVWSTIHPPRM